MEKLYLVILLGCLFSNNLKSQISLTKDNNTPKSGFRYIFKEVKVNSVNVTHMGNDTIWDFSGLINLGNIQSVVFTQDSNFTSFPGYQSPNPLDTSYLRSENAIYRITNNMYYLSHKIIYPPFGNPSYIAQVTEPILEFPFQLNMQMNLDYDGQPYGLGTLEQCTHYKKADAYGSIQLPDSLLINTLRLHTSYRYTIREASHSSYGYTEDTYEWYNINSELPIFKVSFKDNWYFHLGDLAPHHNMDTIALCFMYKEIYNHLNSNLISNLISNDIVLYPNPFNDILNLTSNDKIKEIEIYNMLGILIFKRNDFEQNSVSIKLNNFNQGIYRLKVSSINNIFYRTILKK